MELLAPIPSTTTTPAAAAATPATSPPNPTDQSSVARDQAAASTGTSNTPNAVDPNNRSIITPQLEALQNVTDGQMLRSMDEESAADFIRKLKSVAEENRALREYRQAAEAEQQKKTQEMINAVLARTDEIIGDIKKSGAVDEKQAIQMLETNRQIVAREPSQENVHILEGINNGYQAIMAHGAAMAAHAEEEKKKYDEMRAYLENRKLANGFLENMDSVLNPSSSSSSSSSSYQKSKFNLPPSRWERDEPYTKPSRASTTNDDETPVSAASLVNNQQQRAPAQELTQETEMGFESAPNLIMNFFKK